VTSKVSSRYRIIYIKFYSVLIIIPGKKERIISLCRAALFLISVVATRENKWYSIVMSSQLTEGK